MEGGGPLFLNNMQNSTQRMEFLEMASKLFPGSFCTTNSGFAHIQAWFMIKDCR